MGRQSISKARIRDPKKRENWVEELLPHFFTTGIKALPIDQVLDIIQTSKATFYKHFESHHEVVSCIVAKKLSDLELFVPILRDESKTYQDRYKLAVAYISKNLSDVHNVFLSDLKEVYPDLWNLIQSFKTVALGELRQFYINGINSGTFSNLDPDLMVLSDDLFFDALTNPEYLTEKGINIQTAFDSYFEMRFHGILKQD